MKQQNICKFITNESSDKICTTNFVFETTAVNREELTPKTNAVYLVTDGRGRLCAETVIKELSSGCIFFTFAQVPFQIENIDCLQYMYISFHGGRSAELFARFGITPSNCLFEGHEGLVTFWQNAIIKANEKNLDLISESVLLYTFGEMSPRKKNEEQNLIGIILKYVEDHFHESDLNLNVLSEALSYNSKYISRLFKNEMGITFSTYLTNVRIQHATFLIEQGVTAIKNVALLSGYKDPFYFSNVFKTVVGMSPSEYISKSIAL